MNGNQIKNATIAHIIDTNTAIKLPAVAINAPKLIGDGHGTCAMIGFTSSNLIVQYPIDAETIGAKKNGIAKNGL